MSEKKVFPDASVSFEIEVDDDMREFMEKQMYAFNTMQEAVNKRIDELFKEKVVINGSDEKGIMIARNLFTIGYQLGWNDFRNVIVQKNGEL